LRITKYAERLLEGLETVDFPDSLKEMQKNWIGRSEGASVNFKLAEQPDNVVVFTTRPDTIFGVSFMVLAPEHSLVEQITSKEQKTTVTDYVNYCKSRSELERKSETKEITGAFTGAYVQHPFTGKSIPIYIAEYVLMGYGTGAIMAVPCGDNRDHAFALKFGISIPNIFEGIDVSDKAYEEKTAKIANSRCDWFSIDGLTVSEAQQKVLEKLEDLKIGTKQINYRMRDAGFSRQRYWGEPFPISYNNEIAVADTLENLPITLPEVKSYKPSGDGKSPLSNIPEWVNLKNGNIRETDTMPGYAGSSWYYLRYMDPQNPDTFCDKQKSDYWQQVDLYIGGAEHAVGHLLYSRMWCKVLHDLGYINFDEPYKKLLNQGMIGGVVYHFYYDQTARKIYSDSFKIDRSDLLQFKVPNEYVSDDETFSREGIDAFCNEFTQFKGFEFVMENGTFTFEKAITKMSKRLRNVVNPDEVIAKYGADTFRMYEMFLGPIDQDKPWNTKGIDGVSRFIKRFWAYCIDESGTILLNNEPANEASLKVINRTLKKIAEDIEKYSFNTCVSSFMICLNELQTQKCRNHKVFEKFLIMLSPFAPHTAEELWHRIGNTTTILDTAYPAVDEKYLTDDTFNYPISINGKTRIILPFALDADSAEIEKTVLADATVIKWIEGKPVKKFILVKGRIVNVVV
jgi:leucyl-tRNA synthetase